MSLSNDLYTRNSHAYCIGVCLAWCLASEGTQSMHEYLLSCFRAANPNTEPQYWMSDRDNAQINAIQKIYPKSTVLLCWWHVLHAWQQHFKTSSFPELWQKLKEWIRVTDNLVFNDYWQAIQLLAPESFKNYLQDNWLSVQKLWSAVYRTERCIHTISDTNMLIES